MLEWLITRNWFYWFGRAVFRLYARIAHGVRISGTENIPPSGAVVLAANHFSSLDPPMLGAFFPREVHFMAKQELFDNPGTRLLMLGFRVFPVRRGGQDTAAMRLAIRKIQSGMPVGIFVQGTRSRDNLPAHRGAAFMALKGDAPVLPAALYRQGRSYHIIYGPVIPVEGHTAVSLTAELTSRINELLPSNMRIGTAV